jgi:hypothetical protein
LLGKFAVLSPLSLSLVGDLSMQFFGEPLKKSAVYTVWQADTREELIREKELKPRNLWHCPFNARSPSNTYDHFSLIFD